MNPKRYVSFKMFSVNVCQISFIFKYRQIMFQTRPSTQSAIIQIMFYISSPLTWLTFMN